MAETIGELVYKIEADVKGFGAKISEVENQIARLEKTTQKSIGGQAASVFKGVAAWDVFQKTVATATQLIEEGVKGALEEMQMMNQTRAILENQGKSWDEVGQSVIDFGNDMLKVGIDNETASLQVAKFSQRLGGDLKKSMDTARLAADLAASGFGDFKSVSEDLERVLAGKGQRALIKYGVQLKDNATITEQLTAIQGVASVKAEDYANSTNGQLQKIKLGADELKSAFGKGLIVAFGDAFRQAGVLNDQFALNADTQKALSKIAFQLASTLVLIGQGALLSAKGIQGLSKLLSLGLGKTIQRTIEFARDLAIILNKLGADIDISGFNDKINEFKGANESLLTDLDKLGEQSLDLWKGVVKSIGNVAGSGFDEAMKKTDEADMKFSKASANRKLLTQEEIDAQQELAKAAEAAGKKGAEEAKKQAAEIKEVTGKLLDLRDTMEQISEQTAVQMTDAFKKFNEELTKDVADSNTKLAEIVVNAEEVIAESGAKRKELLAQQAKEEEDAVREHNRKLEDLNRELNDARAKGDADRQVDLQRTLERETADYERATNERKAQNEKALADLEESVAKQQKVLDAQATFQERLDERVAAKRQQNQELAAKIQETTDPVQRAALEAELSARTLAFIKLQDFGNLDKEITEQRRIASLDEFSRFEEETFQRIDLRTEEFVQEISQLAQRREMAIAVEEDITKAIKSNIAERQSTIDAFAVATISRMQQIGSAAQSAMNALAALQSQQSRGGSSIGKAIGGYTVGGEHVHSGEWVMPAWMVQRFSGLVNSLENVRSGSGSVMNKNISAPITVHAELGSGVDVRGFTREMGWELNRL